MKVIKQPPKFQPYTIQVETLYDHQTLSELTQAPHRMFITYWCDQQNCQVYANLPKPQQSMLSKLRAGIISNGGTS